MHRGHPDLPVQPGVGWVSDDTKHLREPLLGAARIDGWYLLRFLFGAAIMAAFAWLMLSYLGLSA